MINGMNNLLWIKNLYIHDEIEQPSVKVKTLGSILSLCLGLIFMYQKKSLLPLLFCLFTITLVNSNKYSKYFFQYLGTAFFYVFQTMNLVLLTVIFYFLITPMAILHRIFDKNDQFFKKKTKDTISKTYHLKTSFERQF